MKMRLARTLVILLAAALSLWALWTFAASAQVVLRDHGALLPSGDPWSAALLGDALHELGLGSSFYALYSLAAAALFVLVFLACAWLTLFRKNQNWFGYYLTLLLAGWGAGFNAFLPLHDPSPVTQVSNSYLSWFVWPGLFFLLYFFPSGQVSPRWARWFAWAWGLFSVLGLVAFSILHLTVNFLYFLPVQFAVMMVGGYAQVYRYRHAGALERQQIKWVVAALLFLVAAFILIALTVNFTGLTDPRGNSPAVALVVNVFVSSLGTLTFIGVPISIALAMLRYRLWDIDLVIRRTLQYAALTALLGLVYYGSVLLLQQLLGGLAGNSSPALVISTLLSAVLFNPLRRRIQDFIDRRFNRARYNAAQALEGFSQSLRAQVDLPAVEHELTEVVGQTLQPEQVSLWLRKGGKA